MTSAEGMPPGGSGPRVDNGLSAPTFSPLVDVTDDVALHLLSVLGRARIAAYLTNAGRADRRRLYVDAGERADARTVVDAAMRALGRTAELPDDDPLAGIDTDSAFAAMVADWHVDTVRAIRDAERDLTREDDSWRERLIPPTPAEPVWLEDEHYVPPAPPPLPRLSAPTVLAMVMLALSVLLLGLGGALGLATDLTLFLGVGGVLGSTAILVSRLRADRDEDDDGTAV